MLDPFFFNLAVVGLAASTKENFRDHENMNDSNSFADPSIPLENPQDEKGQYDLTVTTTDHIASNSQIYLQSTTEVFAHNLNFPSSFKKNSLVHSDDYELSKIPNQFQPLPKELMPIDEQDISEHPIESVLTKNSHNVSLHNETFQTTLTLAEHGSQIPKGIEFKEEVNLLESKPTLVQSPLLENDSGSSQKDTKLEVSTEYRLVNFLLSHYNKHIRPIKEVNEVTFVFVELSLFNVLKMVSQKKFSKLSPLVSMHYLNLPKAKFCHA